MGGGGVGVGSAGAAEARRRRDKETRGGQAEEDVAGTLRGVSVERRPHDEKTVRTSVTQNVALAGTCVVACVLASEISRDGADRENAGRDGRGRGSQETCRAPESLRVRVEIRDDVNIHLYI